MSADLGRRARVTFVFAGLAALFPLADYLSDNSAHSIQRRYSRENAAVLAAVPQAYAANAYPACGSLDEEDEEAVSCNVPGSRRVLHTTPDAGAVILIVAE